MGCSGPRPFSRRSRTAGLGAEPQPPACRAGPPLFLKTWNVGFCRIFAVCGLTTALRWVWGERGPGKRGDDPHGSEKVNRHGFGAGRHSSHDRGGFGRLHRAGWWWEHGQQADALAGDRRRFRHHRILHETSEIAGFSRLSLRPLSPARWASPPSAPFPHGVCTLGSRTRKGTASGARTRSERTEPPRGPGIRRGTTPHGRERRARKRGWDKAWLTSVSGRIPSSASTSQISTRSVRCAVGGPGPASSPQLVVSQCDNRMWAPRRPRISGANRRCTPASHRVSCMDQPRRARRWAGSERSR